jgi:putative PIN family toxin of toxin-antitoxin system
VRVFLDANVLVSAFAARGLCSDLFELVLLEHELIVGRTVLRELSKALRQKVRLPPGRTAEIVDLISGESSQVVERPASVEAGVDPDDALVLGEALAGRAEVFITGDGALLDLVRVNELRIMSPRCFWETLRSE